MPEIMNNMYDFTFKSITLDPNLKDFMCYILHAITRIDYNELIEGKFLNTYIPIKKKGDKVRVSDVILSTKNYIINIEANKDYYPGVFKKNNSYYQELLSRMYKQGQNYNLSKKVIQVNIDDFSIPRIKLKKAVSKYVLKELETNNKFIENDIEKYYIDLKYLEKISRKKDFKNLSRLDRYLLIFKLTDEEEIERLVEEDEIMKKIFRKIREMNEDEELIGAYVKEERDLMELNTRLSSAEKTGYDKGIIETAKKLIKNNVDINTVSKVTGLSKSKINSL